MSQLPPVLLELADRTAEVGYPVALRELAEAYDVSRLSLHRLRKSDPAAEALVAEAEELIALEVADLIRRAACDPSRAPKDRLDAAKAYLRTTRKPAAAKPRRQVGRPTMGVATLGERTPSVPRMTDHSPPPVAVDAASAGTGSSSTNEARPDRPETQREALRRRRKAERARKRRR